MSEAETYFIKLSEEIPDVQLGKMFGALCMKTPNGKSSAMFWKDNIVVKLQGEPLNEAMSLDGAQVFTPMEGRPMNGWVQVPFAYKDKWKKLAKTSAESVKQLPKNVKKKSG
jgi:hypothetical protein